MDRQAWLDQRRAAVLASYDQDAPTYDDHGYPAQTQRNWVARLLGACPAAAKILDAPCGTGSYFPMVTAAGHRVVGADQSAGMLAQARARGIAIALDQVRLQELPYAGEFDAVMTIDAMEHVPPEDWPLVLANLHRAASPGGLLYLTVEEGGQAGDRGRVRDAHPARAAGRARRSHRRRCRRLPLLPRPRPGNGLVPRGGTADHRRGLQPGRRLGLPPLPAPTRQAVTHPTGAVGHEKDRDVLPA